MNSLSFDEVLGLVFQDDVNKQEERVKKEREARRALRLQAQNSGCSIGELVDQISGTEQQPVDPVNLSLPTREEAREPERKGSFPPPPNVPGTSRT